MLFRSDRKSTRLNSSHTIISYAVFCLKKKKNAAAEKEDGGGTDVAGRRSYAGCIDLPLHSSPTTLTNRACSLSIFTLFIFFFNDTATTEIYTLSLHDALPI